MVHQFLMLAMSCLVLIGNTYEISVTNDSFPFIFTGITCTGSENRLRDCHSRLSTDTKYCSNNKVVKLNCEGEYKIYKKTPSFSIL